VVRKLVCVAAGGVAHGEYGVTMENPCANPPKFFSADFFAVAFFSGVGLVVALIAALCNEQGSWL